MADQSPRHVPTGLLIEGREVAGQGTATRAIDPRTGREDGQAFTDASANQVGAATAAAAGAREHFGTVEDQVVVDLLRAVAAGLRTHEAQLVDLADRETALGTPRLRSEMARTAGQLCMFADIVAARSHLDIVIEPGDHTATPPRPDLRRMRLPVGPVAVFGASNFPFAFGVAGGDTASALAARCPVVVKVHPAHPGTSAVVGDIIREQVASCGLPAGVVSLLHGADPEVSQVLVASPEIEAVGFTGSATAGLALESVARSRPRPIPVYAEMGSVNPVVVTPGGVEVMGVAGLAEQIAASVAMGWGQFCTKPGVVAVPAAQADAVVDGLTAALEAAIPLPLLTRGMADRVRSFTESVGQAAQCVGPAAEAAAKGHHHPAVVVSVAATDFLTDASLREEVFGPAVVVVAVADQSELSAVIAAIEGSLTGTVWSGAADDDWAGPVVAQLLPKVGRLLGAGVPTGVVVSAAQQHGGPLPATTVPEHTSVGARAVDRFTRPVVFQDMPDHLLPRELHHT